MQTIENITNYLIIRFEKILDRLFGLFNSVPEKTQGYNADFASESSLLSTRNKGFCLTGTKNLSVKHSYQNAIVIGGTGVGKSSVVLIPSLYSMSGSFIINDPSGELFAKTSGALAKKGYDIKVLNFTKPESSSGYNPIKRAGDSSSIQKVASLLVENALGGKGKDPFWNTQAVSLISMLITILKTQDDAYCNLYNVRQLLNKLSGGKEKEGEVDALFSQYADDILFSEYKSFINMDDKVTTSVIATCKSALQIFNDESVARVTCFDNIDFQDFRDRLTALYIQNSTTDQKYYSVITSLFFEQFFSYVFSRFPKDSEQDIFLLIDEASSLRLPTLPLACANVRKHRAGIMLLLQDFNQLIYQYGKQEADGIKSNCFGRLVFTGSSFEQCKEMSELMGKYTYEDEDKKKVVRSLMLPEEIRTMKDTEAILVCGHFLPIKANLKPHYKSTQYRNYANSAPAVIVSHAPAGAVPILTIMPIQHEEVA
jgi:type IV secretory pathway TraG/TraD family ATPase VirD4